MRKFEIEPKSRYEYATNNYKQDYMSRFEYAYNVKSEGFEADVTVFHFKNTTPFVHKHHCTKGGELLWGFDFWNNLQKSVLEYHNKAKVKVKEEK